MENIDVRKIDYRKYYRDVRKDFKELKSEYPYSQMYMLPTVEPQQIELRVVAVHIDVIRAARSEEEDFLKEYSKELQIVIPWDYKKNGCKVYGGSWLQEDLICIEDRHFYKQDKRGMREFCVGVKDSFQTLNNVILENVKTAENMLIAYEQVQKGIARRAKLIGYAHGKKGEREYESNRQKYKSM